MGSLKTDVSALLQKYEANKQIESLHSKFKTIEDLHDNLDYDNLQKNIRNGILDITNEVSSKADSLIEILKLYGENNVPI